MLAGLILAGGEGRRWGGPKAWARLPDGRSFVERCTLTLREAGAGVVVATLPPGTSDPEVEGLRAVPLPEPGLDMFASLQIGLSELLDKPEWQVVAVLPVDHPLVRPETVARLAASTRVAAAPVCEGKRGHPVCLCRGLAEQIAAGRAGGATLRQVLRRQGRDEIVVDDPGVVTNCNTPEALKKALERGARL